MPTVNFYRTKTAHCPVEEFLDSLTGKQVQKIVWVLRLIEELPIVPRQYFKKLVNTDNIWEVRVQLGNDIFRLLGFLDEPNTLVLTHGFVKKTQKTPTQEITLAEQRKQDFFTRRSKL